MIVLRFLVAYATPLMVAAVIASIVIQPLAALVKPLLLPLLILALSLAIMRTDPRALGAALRRPLPALAQVAWLLIAAPLLVYGAALLLPLPEALRAPLVLAVATPPINSMPAFALLFGLDATFVLIGVIGATILSPITVPLIADLVAGGEMAISPFQLAIRLGLMMGTSFAVGLVLRRLLGAHRIARWRLQLDAAFVLSATLIGIAVMDGVVALTRSEPVAMALTLAAVSAATLSLIVLGALLFLPAGRAAALGAGLNSGPRSISIVLAVLGAAASDELVMVVAATQFPIFVYPLFERPIIRWLMRAHPGPGETQVPRPARDSAR